MKNNIKKFFIILIILIFSFFYVAAQEDSATDADSESKTEVVKKDSAEKKDKSTDEKKSDAEKQPEENNDTESDEVDEQVEPVETEEVEKKVIPKRNPVKRNTAFKMQDAVNNIEVDNGLLGISPGENIFQRIPEIKLDNKKKIVEVDKIVRIPDSLEENGKTKNASGPKDFFGFNEETTEIVAKGSIIVLILLVFILYKARSKGTIRRS